MRKIKTKPVLADPKKSASQIERAVAAKKRAIAEKKNK